MPQTYGNMRVFFAASVDFGILDILSLFFILLLVILGIFFLIRYLRSRGKERGKKFPKDEILS